MKYYYLYPPFLYVPEEHNFSDVWEVFCLKLLKVDYKTTAIERRTPPEKGIDLYYKEQRKAFQCKSSLENNSFNITKAKKSLESALELKNSLPWDKYYLCTNKNLTGEQVSELQKIHKDVEPKGKDYWVGLCKENPSMVQNNFRSLLEVEKKRIVSDLSVQLNIKDIESKLTDEPINLLFYSEVYDKIYKITISKNALVRDLFNILRNILDFSKVFSENDGKVHITHYFTYNGDEYHESSNIEKSLTNIGLIDGAIITYFIRVFFINEKVHKDIMHFNSLDQNQAKLKNITNEIFSNFDHTLEGYYG